MTLIPPEELKNVSPRDRQRLYKDFDDVALWHAVVSCPCSPLELCEHCEDVLTELEARAMFEQWVWGLAMKLKVPYSVALQTLLN